MADDIPLITSLRTAVAAAPDDVPLRLHLAEVLIGAGRGDEAIAEIAVALQRAPGDAQARALMARAMGTPVTPVLTPQQVAAIRQLPDAEVARTTGTAVTAEPGAPLRAAGPDGPEPAAARATAPDSAAVPGLPGVPVGGPSEAGAADAEPESAEGDTAKVVPLRFVRSPVTVDGSDDPGETEAWEVDGGGVRLADVGGMTEVKQRLEAAFLAPMRNPELRKLYGKSMRGGLLLYGPPGCGKTFIARAVAGELGAKFLAVGINDVLDMYIGNSERNLHEVFETARRNAPCVLFLDELDALGAKRSQMRHNGMRTAVNQLLTELDGVKATANDGVFVLAATNHPWDVDSALRRPGRLDRTLLVLPPDAPAREAILRYHLEDRPVEGVDLGVVTVRTEGFSGADLEHLCETAAERALLDSVASGTPRPIGTEDLLAALDQVRPSTGPWFGTARNVAEFANEGGMYDELLAYLKGRAKRKDKRRP